MASIRITKDKQYVKFCAYGFLKNLRFFEPFFILFFMERGLSFLEIGSLYAIREIMKNVFEIPSGIIADAFGRRKTLASSFLIYIVSFVLFYLGSVYWMFAIAMVFYALGDAARSGVHKALIFEYLQQSGQSSLKVAYYGHTRSWSQFGSAISSLGAGILVFYDQHMDTIFLFAILPYLLDFFNVLTYPTKLDGHISPAPGYRKKMAATMSTFFNTMNNKKSIIAILNSSVYTGFYKSVKDFIQPFLKSVILQLPLIFAFTQNQQLALLIGIVYFLIFISNSFVSRKSSVIESFFGSSTNLLNASLLIGSLLGIIAGLLMNYQYGLIVILFFIVILFIENARKPSGIVVITERCDPSVHAGVLSVASQMASVFAAGFVLIIGYLADEFGVGIGVLSISALMLLSTPFFRLNK